MTNRYCSFLLRIWLVDTPAKSTWRASLEDPHTRQVTSFSDIEALCAYLKSLDPPSIQTPPSGYFQFDQKKESE